MKPTKTYKKPAKRNPIIDKLMKLKYRMSDWYKTYGKSTQIDRQWVMGQISALREGARLDTHQMKHANQLWRKYAQ